MNDDPASRNRILTLAAQKRPLPIGVVKWYNSQRGFGFTQPKDGGKDAFAHVSAIECAGGGDLREDPAISFEPVGVARSGGLPADKLQAV